MLTSTSMRPNFAMRRIDQLLRGALLREVELQRGDASLLDGGKLRSASQILREDLRARRRKGQRGRPADAGDAAGHHHHFVFQIVEHQIPCFCRPHLAPCAGTRNIAAAGSSGGRQIARGLVVWFLIMLAETIHGMLRGLLLVPLVGDTTAGRIGWPVGVILVMAISLMTVRWTGMTRRQDLLPLGVLWAALTFAFEVLIGFLRGLDAPELLAAINPLAGGLISTASRSCCLHLSPPQASGDRVSLSGPGRRLSFRRRASRTPCCPKLRQREAEGAAVIPFLPFLTDAVAGDPPAALVLGRHVFAEARRLARTVDTAAAADK